MTCLESSLTNKRLLFFLDKNKAANENKPFNSIDRNQSLKICSKEKGSLPMMDRTILQMIDSNGENIYRKRRKTRSCFKNNNRQKIKNHVLFSKPQLLQIKEAELKKELLSHKNTIAEYISYSVSQDLLKSNINLNKLIKHEQFCQNFFTFRRHEDGPVSRHIHIALDGAYFPKRKPGERFVDRLFEENKQLCMVEFVWQNFLNNRCHLVSPILGEKKIEIKRYNSNFLGEFTVYIKLYKLNLIKANDIDLNMVDYSQSGTPSNILQKNLNPFTLSSLLLDRNVEGLMALGEDSLLKQFGRAIPQINAREFAIISGKCLAFIIANTDLFEDCLVSLIGFSGGAIAAYHCAYDLFRLGKLDKLSSLCLVGAPLRITEIDQDLITNLHGRVFNVFSHDDYLMRYVLNDLGQTEEEPLGLRKFQRADFVDMENQERAIGKDLGFVRNLDLTEWVKSHSEYKFHAEVLLDFLFKAVPFELLYSRVQAIID